MLVIHCSANASCSNTDSAFDCTCNAGYKGDGVNCSYIDECMTAADNCDNNASCTNNVGGFSCACSSGYSGDGIDCSDFD